MKSLFINMGDWGSFILGVALAFDVTGKCGMELLHDRIMVKSSLRNPGSDAHNLADDWRNLGSDFQRALKAAHEQQ